MNMTFKNKFINEIIVPACENNALIIKAFERVPREKFLDDAFKYRAYKDIALPIGHQQTISKPSTVAKMISGLFCNENANVLEIGTGSGYQTAILSKIFSHVYTIEVLPHLYSKASKILKSLYISNVTYKIGNGYNGLPEYAPYDNIIISAELSKIPEPLIKQLKIGGLMVAPYNGNIVKIMKIDNFDVNMEKLGTCKFVNFVLE
jgi:protein-L-isoaspartate(D-aspartate) O-methyltransferase